MYLVSCYISYIQSTFTRYDCWGWGLSVWSPRQDVCIFMYMIIMMLFCHYYYYYYDYYYDYYYYIYIYIYIHVYIYIYIYTYICITYNMIISMGAPRLPGVPGRRQRRPLGRALRDAGVKYEVCRDCPPRCRSALRDVGVKYESPPRCRSQLFWAGLWV